MSFRSERNVKAVRKRHRCDGCNSDIEVGDPAVRWAGMTDGDFGSLIFHVECREAEIALNRLLEVGWYDDWCGLQDIDGEDRPWLIDTFPVVAQRMGFSASSVSAGGE